MGSLLLQDWKFIHEDVSDAFYGDYNDEKWLDVVVPHDWSVSYPFSREHSSGTGYLPGGIGWYRTKFKLDENYETAFIKFDGVYKNAQVWFNGNYLGKRPNGYIGFKYDVSQYLKPENTVAVKVTHTDIADSRWFTGSGIYRKVTVTAHKGAYIPSESVLFTFDGENINIKARVVGGLSAPVTIALGENSWTSASDIDISARIENPKLWSPKTPYLYELSFESAGAPLCPPIQVGLRTFRFDPDTGFSLNGENMKIKGVCVHHDAGCLGAAVWPDVWRRRLEKLKECGCNAIRTAHNPAMPELYDLCDELGFLVMDEAFDEWEGCKNKWAHGHNVYPPAHQGYSEDFPQWRERDLADMVVRDRNHPCVFLWSIGNEIDYPNDPYVHPLFGEMTGNNDSGKPASERVYNENKPNMERITTVAKELAAIVRRYDKTRPVTTAAAFPELSSRIGFFEPFDVMSYNYKNHLFESDHKRFPNLPFIANENGHGLEQWEIVRAAPYIAGQFLWTGVDFLGEAKGWPIRGAQCGLLDTAGFEKPEYYKRREMWTGEKPPLPEQYKNAREILLSKYGAAQKVGDYYLHQIEVKVTDADGHVCLDCEAMLNYVVENGIIIGIENGDLSDCQEYAVPYRRVHNGRAIVYLLAKGGVTLTAQSENESLNQVITMSFGAAANKGFGFF
ncbi:MAG: beta galactosidase jelly roll domain-containing protein [Clostridiales bacterium]|jgi:beta-galactosidase/beta-glucuronidase|nr:beta galactosidase jelly roll domain-containing protein [Clostridiales bacterium]